MLDKINWATAKGIADEPNFDEFIRSVGGTRVDVLLPNPTFENADYFLSKAQVVIELKILETEFGGTPEFIAKLDALIQHYVIEKDLRGPLLGQPYPRQFLLDMVELFRPPLARIASKANRQIRETKKRLGAARACGLLICVNDNFRELEPPTVLWLLSRILNGAYSSISGLVYLTNHHVRVPGSEYANLLWAPMYSDSAPDSLPELVNSLGRQWAEFCEQRLGKFDSRIETEEVSLVRGTRIIR